MFVDKKYRLFVLVCTAVLAGGLLVLLLEGVMEAEPHRAQGAPHWHPTGGPYLGTDSDTIIGSHDITTTRATVSAVSSPTHQLYLPLAANRVPYCPPPRNPRKGLAWAYFDREIEPTPQFIQEALCIGWYHTWIIPDTNPLEEYGVETYPVFWCDVYPSDAQGDEVRIDYKQDALQKLGPDYDGYLLFLNEPDLPAPQCDRTPREGAELYVWVKQNLPQAKLVGPMVSHVDALDGWRWLQAWRQEVIALTDTPPDLYAYSIHDYTLGELSYVADTLHDLMTAWGDGDKSMWVTEFGSQSPQRIAQMIDFYNNDARIARFAGYTPLMVDNDFHTNFRFFYWDSAELTPLGESFAAHGNETP